MKAASGTIQRVIPFRLSPGEDVYQALQQLCEQEHLENGVFLSGIGSLEGIRVFDIQHLPNTVAGCGYGDPIEMAGLFELLSISGLIGLGEDGKPNMHLHCVFADKAGHAFGGHMCEGCTVKMTVEGCIGELAGVAMKREYQPDLDAKVLNPITLR